MTKHTCGRRKENFIHGDKEDEDYYRPDGTCSYCGSLSGDSLMAMLEAGEAELGPTDKSYKVYVNHDNINKGKLKIVGSANFDGDHGDGWVKVTEGMKLPTDRPQDYKVGSWVLIEPDGDVKHSKFYFQHFTKEQMIRFIELLNEKKLKIGYPGHFYSKPYFIA